MPTFGSLKRDLAALMGDVALEGTATGGTSSTLVDANNLGQADDTWIDYSVRIYAGTGAGQERRITDSSQSGTSITVSPNWATNPSTDSKYYVYKRFQNAAYEAAFLTAMRWLRQHLLVPERDVSISLGDPELAATFNIDITSLNFATIMNIIRENSNKDDVFDIPMPGPHESVAPWWWIERDGANVYLRLDRRVHLNNGFVKQGRDLLIIGQRFETEPTADTSTITVNSAPIVILAAMVLRMQEARGEADLADLRSVTLSRLNIPAGARPWAGALKVLEG